MRDAVFGAEVARVRDSWGPRLKYENVCKVGLVNYGYAP